MSDAELEDIRANRLAQLQAQQKGGTDKHNPAEDKEREASELKNSILSQILTQPARTRLNTLMIGKPEKGRMVESMLVQMARSGQLMGKLGEDELISILEKVNEQMSQKTVVKFDRRRVALDSDDENF